MAKQKKPMTQDQIETKFDFTKAQIAEIGRVLRAAWDEIAYDLLNGEGSPRAMSRKAAVETAADYAYRQRTTDKLVAEWLADAMFSDTRLVKFCRQSGFWMNARYGV